MPTPFPNNIFLTGFMGAGKSTVGPLLARHLGWQYVDTDREIEQKTRRSVAEIFATDGEPAFRTMESDVIRALSRDQKQVVSLGGGALIATENQRLLLDTGLLIYLKARPDTLVRRVPQPAARPLLRGYQGAALEQHVQNLLSDREVLYALATLTVETDAMTPDETVQAILRSLP